MEKVGAVQTSHVDINAASLLLQRMVETMANALLTALGRASIPTSSSMNPAPTPILTPTPIPTSAPAPLATASPVSRINNALKRYDQYSTDEYVISVIESDS